MKKKVETVVKRNAWSNGNGLPPSFTRRARRGGRGRGAPAHRSARAARQPTRRAYAVARTHRARLSLIAPGAHSVALTPPVPPNPPQTAQTAFGEWRAGAALPSVSLRRPLARAPSPAPAPLSVRRGPLHLPTRSLPPSRSVYPAPCALPPSHSVGRHPVLPNVYTHTSIHPYTQTHTHTHTHTHIHTHTYIYKHKNIYTYMHTYIQAYIHILVDLLSLPSPPLAPSSRRRGAHTHTHRRGPGAGAPSFAETEGGGRGGAEERRDGGTEGASERGREEDGMEREYAEERVREEGQGEGGKERDGRAGGGRNGDTDRHPSTPTRAAPPPFPRAARARRRGGRARATPDAVGPSGPL